MLRWNYLLFQVDLKVEKNQITGWYWRDNPELEMGIETRLNRLGEIGWELINVTPTAMNRDFYNARDFMSGLMAGPTTPVVPTAGAIDGFWFFLKRPLSDEES